MASTEWERAMASAANVLEELGRPTTAEFIRSIADSKLGEYVDKAIEAGLAANREQLEIEYAGKRAQLQMEYKILTQPWGQWDCRDA